ncbi:SDR family oxidoreductase [Burkholderia ubonensis]|uniref:SDR family oxidoreductase n=1 Tax=Burkholderia ubonensis TaxID=101571 RepID=UPI0009B51107|nr:SDR family oxidoreductase [Burkholderia ubonensis]
MSQVVVVSGGGTGIGFATARHFAQRGAQVAIVGRRADVLAHAAEQIGNAFRMRRAWRRWSRIWRCVADTAFFGAALSDVQRKDKVAESLNGRAGTPDDIANTIGWLASPDALHVTGQVIQVNGGAERSR